MGTTLEIASFVSAGREWVWTCYTSPEHIVNWNFASEDWQCPWATNELHPGGRYVARMEARDGSVGFDLAAVYEEVRPGKGFTFILEDGRRVEFELTAENRLGEGTREGAGTGTRVDIRFEAENIHPLEMQRDGWQSILDRFTAYAGSIAPDSAPASGSSAPAPASAG